jgi:hypothetical protein
MTLILDIQMVVKGDGIEMRKAIAGALLVLAIACMTMPACGQMFPMSYGFPNVVHSLQSTAWQHDTLDAFDFDDASIMPYGGGMFPSIHQTSIHTRSMSHTEFSQTTEFTAIGYPYVSASPFGGFTRGY